MDSAAIIFLHIPKTGGVTLSNILQRQYSQDVVYRFDPTDRASAEGLQGLPVAERRKIKAIYGHMSFGLHTLLPQTASYITLLRHPIKRAISDYNFVRTNTQHPLHADVKKMDLATYMKSGATGQLVNGQTRLVSGDWDGERPGIPTRNPVSDTDLERAKRNIEDGFVLVGLQERFDESLVLLMRKLGWRNPYYVKANVTSKTAGNSPVSEQDIALIRRQNGLDLELYEFARSRFMKELESEGPTLRMALWKLKAQSTFYRLVLFLTSRRTPNLRSSMGAIVRRFRQV